MSALPDEPPPPPLRTPEPHELTASDGGPLRLDYYAADDDAAPGCGVILCHGFRGYKTWGFLPFLATRLAEEGIPAAAFDFASSGISDRDGTFGEPERFRRGTYAGDLADLARVSDWMAARLGGGKGVRLGLAGHSRGGVISILHAARDRRVGAVATLGSPARIGVWPDAFWDAWRRGESADVYDFRTKRTLRLGPELFRDWSENGPRYGTAAALATLAAPLLVLHGTRDALVPLAEAKELASFGRSTSVELKVIEGAGHSFQAGDELRRTPPALLDAIESVTAWMRRWLQPNEIGDYFFSAGGGV
ncbi:MAG TPA: alpha/beta hydrolase [Candidatus Eisenbacteria bacterium]|nr:alpha/beta hydrolase [Candidatus Eisenbacteria bacterium]